MQSTNTATTERTLRSAGMILMSIVKPEMLTRHVVVPRTVFSTKTKAANIRASINRLDSGMNRAGCKLKGSEACLKPMTMSTAQCHKEDPIPTMRQASEQIDSLWMRNC
jgi:hypothetical protein